MTLSAPEPLTDQHDLTGFQSGVASLDAWLLRRASSNQARGATRTFVVTERNQIVAYYALASGTINATAAPDRFRRNMPDPIPIALLARIAIDARLQRQGIGRGLIRDCAHRVAHAADILGIRGIVTHAISGAARAFYLAVGFEVSPIEPMTLMIILADIRSLLAAD